MIVLALFSSALADPSLRLFGDVKSMHMAVFPYENAIFMPEEPVGQGLLSSRLGADARAGVFRLQVHHVVGVESGSDTAALTSLSSSGDIPQVVDLSWSIHDEVGVGEAPPELGVSGRVDRCVLSVGLEKAAIAVGRQPLTLGRSLLFTPLDLVNPFHPATVDQEYKPGVDAARVDVFAGMASQLTLAAAYAGDWAPEDMMVVGYGQTTLGLWDVGVLAGSVYSDGVFGVSGSGSVGAVGVRAEGTLTLPKDDADPFVRTVLGADWMPISDLMVSGEFYFQSLGADDPNEYLVFALEDRFERGELWTMGQYYFGGVVSYQLSPLLGFGVSSIANLADPSVMLGPGLTWSVSDNAEVSAGMWAGLGERPGEVSQEDLLSLLVAGGEEDVARALGVKSEFGLIPTAAFVQMKAYF